ncbi:NERD domain-containing protein [Massilia horti]|uniref:AAA family ATPase n=1 Tax=Massilia horti TaxID=2562153 RepID=A0A4Y9SL96_9BURK|nr:NERD domain-containing protein [Massilia horti]TFW27445.1 AAA family ATPase [Massilia horti]
MTAPPQPASKVRLYIGAPVEHTSEQLVLQRIWDQLNARTEWAYIFANVAIGSRQVDLVVATAETTLLIEAKDYHLPVQGEINGRWVQEGAFGFRTVTNGYQQALGAKNALRDFMHTIGSVHEYPNAMVVAASGIPGSSKLTKGDYKVRVGDLHDLGGLMGLKSGATWDAGTWDQFAKSLSLQLVPDVAAAIHLDARASDELLAKYLAAFEAYFAPYAQRLLDDVYDFRKGELHTDDATHAVLDCPSAVLIQGPSGCGKTLLARSVAVGAVARGYVPLLLSANTFNGRLQDALNAEAALLDTSSARDILRASRIRSKPLILLIDGFNECPPRLQDFLLRSVRAFSSRYQARIAITTQMMPGRIDLLSSETLKVRPPSIALKERLANHNLVTGDENVSQLLRTARSGLEAVLVGVAGSLLPAGASRFALFDAFSRVKLGALASEGVSLLCDFAGALIANASFGLSVRQFDRLVATRKYARDVRDAVDQSGLLERRGDRMTFIHELFLESFTAEYAIRNTMLTAESLQAALQLPRYESSKAFIVGGLESDTLLHQFLSSCSDPEVLRACADGTCGRAAQEWATQGLRHFITTMTRETEGIAFEMSDRGFQGFAILPETIMMGPTSDTLVPSMWRLLLQGEFLPEMMTALASMDAAIERSVVAHRNAAREKRVSASSGIFAEAYVGSRKAGVSQVVGFIHSGGFPRPKAGPDFHDALFSAWQAAHTHGQFYFLIGLSKFAEIESRIAQYFAPLVKSMRRLPYHLQLDVIDFCLYVNDAPEPFRSQIVEGLEEALDYIGPIMNGLVFEALGRLGALDEAEHEYADTVQAELVEIISRDDHDNNVNAWTFFSRQFDHPFSSAYCEAINGMPLEVKLGLLKKASLGAEPPYISFVGILLRELGDAGDVSAVPGIMPWTLLPDKKHFMPQDAVEVFWEAHKALGKVLANLPANRSEGLTEVDRAMQACADLYYWVSRPDVTDAPNSPLTLPARNTLLKQCTLSAAGALALTSSMILSNSGTRPSLAQAYPDLAIAISRGALRQPDAQLSYYEETCLGGKDSICSFCLLVLGSFGESTDLALVRSFHDHPSVGKAALSAIRALESRTLYAS